MMALNTKINKDHITGVVVGVGICAAGYYIYKKNQNKVDDFLRNQGINVATQSTDFSAMSIEQLMETKETLEDLIAEKQLLGNESAVEIAEEA
ncbi:MAG: hypothetical protein ACRDD2_09430 [Sarcina sp.]